MNSFDIEQTIKSLFLVDPLNKLCVDCRAPLVTHLSVQNAVFLCPDCAFKHEAMLNSTISLVKPIP